MKLRRSKALHETVELNITAFLNLMVILVPFLLITAVFSRITVLELNLPQLNSTSNPGQKIDLQLQLVITPEFVDVRDATVGRLKEFPTEGGAINWAPITELLLAIKTRYPEKTDITLLLHKDIPYKTLIAVMDHVRSTEVVNVATLEEVELFPAVSIGDAPELTELSTQEVSLDTLPPAQCCRRR